MSPLERPGKPTGKVNNPRREFNQPLFQLIRLRNPIEHREIVLQSGGQFSFPIARPSLD
jgi:hypothetical protein